MHRSYRRNHSQRIRSPRGRTRSHPRAQSRSPPRSRHHRNSRSRSVRRTTPHNRPHTNTTETQWEDKKRLLDHWKPNRDFLDTNLIYGLALPRKVISTSSSRTLGIDQTPIHEIRLHQLMQEGSYDWCLCILAAGKACYLEMFQSRQEAFFSCSLHRYLKDNRMDFNHLLQEIAIKENIPSDLTVWENRRQTSAKLVENMLVATWSLLCNKHHHHRLWVVYASWNKKMLSFVPVNLNPEWMEPSTRKSLNILSPMEMNLALRLLYAVQIVICHHHCTHHWHTVLSVLNRRIWHPPHRPSPSIRLFCLASLVRPQSISSTNFAFMSHFWCWKEMAQKAPPFNQWTNGWRPRFWTPRYMPSWTSPHTVCSNRVPVGQFPSVTRFLVEWGMELGQAAKYKDKEATKLLVILDGLRKWLCMKCRSVSTLRTTTFTAQERRLLNCFCTWLAHCRSTLFHHTDTCFLRIYVVLEHFVASLRLYTFHARNSTLFAHLATLGIDPWLSFDQYHSASKVYARMPMTSDDPMWWYIGSTIHSPLFREQSQIRKNTQPEKGTDAFFEPALRIWYARNSFFSFFVTPIRIITDSVQLRAQELALIKPFRPKLNHPHCNPLLKKLRISLQQYVLPTCSAGLLGNTLLQRFFDDRLPVDRAGLAGLWSKPDELFNILYRLGSNSRDKFEVAKLLRSNSTTPPLLYLLYRYCLHAHPFMPKIARRHNFWHIAAKKRIGSLLPVS